MLCEILYSCFIISLLGAAMGSLVKAAIALVLALILFASVLQALAQVYKPNTHGSMQLIKSNNTSATASNVTITTTPIPSINRAPRPLAGTTGSRAAGRAATGRRGIAGDGRAGEAIGLRAILILGLPPGLFWKYLSMSTEIYALAL